MRVNNGQRRRNERRETAKENLEARHARTPQAQLTLLDERLGVGIGAHKERARLQTILQRLEDQKQKTSANKARKESAQNNKTNE